MRAIVIILILFVLLIGAGYFGVPVLIDKQTAGLKSDMDDIKQRLMKMEEFIRVAPLKPDADPQKVINTVNVLYAKVTTLEDSFRKSTAATDDALKKQNAENEATLKKQSQDIENLSKDTQAELLNIRFDATMATIRGHILKARVEISSKNVGTARSELDHINELLNEAKSSATEKNKAIIEELQALLKKARAEIDTDLPSALNKIDLLWYEMSRLLRKA